MQHFTLNRISAADAAAPQHGGASAPTLAPSALLEALNPVQRKAAAHVQGPLLILAGAGSGKTRVLTYRIAYMLEQASALGIQPWNILALTFTNKAAAEMKERIAHLVGSEKADKIWAGTFHSLFARMLRRDAEVLGFTPSFSIYDADDSLSAIRAVMNTLGISQQQYPPPIVRATISGAKNKFISWQEFERTAGNLFEKQVGMVYKEYEKRLRLANAMDFDDLLLNMIRLLQQPAMLEKYQHQFRYILIDEYQDTNKAQYLAVKLFAEKERNICVVGDDAQSIYRWRGADIRNILDFERDYPETEVVRLEQNYRSTKIILEAANNVINNNSKQLKKALWTDNADGEKIHVLRCRDDREEAERIVQTIQAAKRTHTRSLEDFAILYRTNAQSQALEDALRRENVPYIIVGGVSFYKRKEVKDTLAYLRVLVNPSDAESLMRVVNEPTRGLGDTSLRRFADYASTHEISLFQAFEQAEAVVGLQRRAQTAAQGFIGLIKEFQAKKSTMRADELGKALIEAAGLLKMYEDDGSDEALDRWNNIQRLLSHLAEYCERNATNGVETTLEQYLQEIALISDIDEVKAGGNHVTLMTMHAAKGLEFPVVFIAGMERGLFPLAKAEQELEEMEEERRLFYVGITRAEEHLYLSHTEKRYRFGELHYPTPSPFLAEIKPELLYSVGAGVPSAGSGSGFTGRAGSSNAAQVLGSGNIIRSANDLKTRGFQSSAPQAAPKAVSREPFYDDAPTAVPAPASPKPAANGSQPRLRIGMRVKHELFGVGQIINLSGSGDSAQVEVSFPHVGRKKLMIKFAKLTVMD
jgi:DNA helicase-2/ATP-dependent DNA helicase PcrA